MYSPQHLSDGDVGLVTVLVVLAAVVEAPREGLSL
jgi:hypothetical protein